MKSARRMLGFKYNLVRWIRVLLCKLAKPRQDPDFGLKAKVKISGAELIARAYTKIGSSFGDVPFRDLTPVDFDRSRITVRIV